MRQPDLMRALVLPGLLLSLAVSSGAATAAERACDQSESTVVPSPGGSFAASVQHQVCETASGGVSAAITVFVGEAAAPMKGERMVSVAVPRSRDEWPRAVWRGEQALEVWVPNLANVLESKPRHGSVTVALKYCADDPEARAQVAQHAVDLKLWMESVSRWAELRRDDPQGAGPRPPRPEEPRVISRACTDADIPPVVTAAP